MVSAFVSAVSVPYEITLLSNNEFPLLCAVRVSVPYEITLLSNDTLKYICNSYVSVPYEITLLSNRGLLLAIFNKFQYLMKLHYSQT